MKKYFISALLFLCGTLQSFQVLSQDLSLKTNAVAVARELPFQAFFKTPVGSKGLELSQTLLQAHGQRVRLVGYMVDSENPSVGHFLLTPRAIQTSEHADGDATDLPASTCVVLLDAQQQNWTVAHAPGPVAVEGVFRVERVEYPDGKVSWFHLQLDADATRAMSSQEIQKTLTTTHTH